MVSLPNSPYGFRTLQAVPPVNLSHVRVGHIPHQELPLAVDLGHSAVPSTPGRHIVSQDAVPATPGRTGSLQVPLNRRPIQPGLACGFSGGRLSNGIVAESQMPLRSARDRMPSPEVHSSLRLLGSSGQSTGTLLGPSAMAIAASTPVLIGRGSFGRATGAAPLSSSPLTHAPLQSARATASTPQASENGHSASRTSLLSGSSLHQLMAKVQNVGQEREQELRRHLAEQKELDDLLTRSREELQQLVSVFSELRELHQDASLVLPDAQLGPERPRIRPKPPFSWQPSQEYEREFVISGECGEIVTKAGDFEDQGWVIPVGGSWRLSRGGVYRWTIRIEQKCQNRPQLQLGIHGSNHSQPWRLITTSRCSWSRDDEPWQDRPGGDRLIEQGSYVHVEVDMRGVNSNFGTFAIAVDDGPFEQFFDDIPLGQPYPLIPVVSMGGDQSRVRLCPNY